MTILRRLFSGVAPIRPQITSLTSETYANYYLRLLQSCRDLNFLLQIHGRLIIAGLEQHEPTFTNLINSYSLFRKPELSRLVFDSKPDPTVFQWNSMIKAYTRASRDSEALELYHDMIEKSIEPDKYTFTFVLKACIGADDLQEGVLVHRRISYFGLESDRYIGAGLVHMYCKVGDLKSAREVFDKIPDRDVVAWNAMISGLSKSADPHEALDFFRGMHISGIATDSVSLLNLIPAVSKLADIRVCKSVHCFVIKRDFSHAVYNGLIDMYCKCGDVTAAQCIFDGMSGKDDVSWGTMMSGSAYNGCWEEVLELFDLMVCANVKMNKAAATSALLSAVEMEDLKKGKLVYECIMRQGICKDVSVGTLAITMYAKCGELEKAKELFWALEEKDIIAWSATIAAFLQAGYPEDALSLFQSMQNENVRLNSVTLLSVLSASAELASLKGGKSIHCYAVKANIEFDLATTTALLSMYAKLGLFTSALIIFDRMPVKDVVAWNALISAYAQIGDSHNAVMMFRNLQFASIKPDSGTMLGLLSAYSLLNDPAQGSCIHGQVIKFGFDSDSLVQHGLIDMYAKCGSISSAYFLFNDPEFMKSTVSWNIMICGYFESGHAREAISGFREMKLENFLPNMITFVSVLPAVASLTAIREGMSIHASAIRAGYRSCKPIGNSLIDMYAKCGLLDYSKICFDEMGTKDTVSWNALLAGYAIHGLGNLAVSFFSLMQERNVQADSVSLLNVLSACRHAGLIEEGKNIFKSMQESYFLEPQLEHYACMVDLLGRAGLFDEAFGIIRKSRMVPDARIWGALLSASRMHSNVELGEVAMSHLVKLEPGNTSNHAALSALYSQAGRSRLINQTVMKKNPGCSWLNP